MVSIDWRARQPQRDRWVWYVCRYGMQHEEQVRYWPMSKIHRAVDAISFLLKKEFGDKDGK